MPVNSSSAQLVPIDCDYMSITLLGSAFNIGRGVLLLPLSTFILYLGFQQWRQQRSFQSASHFDVFTYHQAIMELIWGLGAGLRTSGVYFNLPYMIIGGKIFSSIVFFGESQFHILTCLERYLAVVHPVTYRGLQSRHGATIRNGNIGFTWLVSWMWSCVLVLEDNTISVMLFLGFLVLSIIIISFCSLSVLWALIRPGPGEGDRNKGQIDQIKRKAFFTVTAILGVVFMWFSAFLIATATEKAKVLPGSANCMTDFHVMWFSLPSSVILPLLYVHKKGAFSN